VVSTLTTRAYGSAERNAALLMAEGLPGTHRVTLGADKGYDAHDFIAELRHMEITRTLRRTTPIVAAPWMSARHAMRDIKSVRRNASESKKCSAG